MVANKVEITEETLRQQLTRDIAFEIVFDKRVDFTLELAERIIGLPAFTGERDLRGGHVDYLVAEAKRGAFLMDMASLVTCECEYDNTERRLNGQHTSWMRTYMPAQWTHKIHWLKYKVKSEDDFRRLYSVIDRGAPRTAAHIINARLYGSDAFSGIPKRILSLLQSGLKVYKFGVGGSASRKQKSVDALADLMEGEMLTISKRVGAFLIENHADNSKVGHLRRAACIAAMYASFTKSAEDSESFWKAVAFGLDLTSANDPRYRLRNTLLQKGIYSVVPGKESIGVEEMYRLCIAAWNAYRERRELFVLKAGPKRVAAK